MDRFLGKIGLSKGTLALELEHPTYHLGQEIRGSAKLELKKPYEGQRLWVRVKATQRVTKPKPTRVRRNDEWKNEIQSSTSTLVLYDYKLELDGHHYYDQGEYPFRLPLPCELPKTEPDSDLVKAAELVQVVFSGVPVSRGPIKWQVDAKLEIPWSLGVSAKKSIQVAERPKQAFQAAPPSSAPAASGPRKKRFCGSCGQKREAEDQFCQHCGRKF